MRSMLPGMYDIAGKYETAINTTRSCIRFMWCASRLYARCRSFEYSQTSQNCLLSRWKVSTDAGNIPQP